MLTSWEKLLFAFIILLTAAAFFLPLYQRYRIVRSGRPEMRFGHLLRRTLHALAKVLFQKCTLKSERPFTGLMHVFIFYGALTFDTMTVNHTLEGFIDKFYLFGNTGFGLFFSLLVDVFAVLVLAGIVFFAVRRFVIRPQAYRTTPLDSALIYVFITAATLSYLYFEGFALAVHPEAARLAFLGDFLAKAITTSGMSATAVNLHFKISWWAHILIVYGFIAYVPHSKYLHLFTGPLNILFRSEQPSGELKSLDIEKAEVFGLERASDFTWKDRLDAFACMECGRCQDACPAFASGKPLSPKMIIVNLKRRLLQERRLLVAGKRNDCEKLIPETYAEDEIWTCTTCGACRHVCPVEIEHIPKIIGVRQSQVLMESRFPTELNTFFRNMETNFNPWGLGFSKRADWTTGLDIPLIADHPQAAYLFWVGCAGSFDEEGMKITRAMATIMKKAGVDFAVLGPEEKCCGDSARRLGNEYLYQTLAGENMKIFLKYNVRRVITICPHGFNTFRNEYPRLLEIFADKSAEDRKRLGKIEIIPHVSLIHSLIEEGKLRLKPASRGAFTYHDPCYLGRHNGLIAEPRDVLFRLSGNKLVELKNSREHSFCCGAGGGLMWTEEKLGRRINHLRTEEVIAAGAETAATSCPFCLNMLHDGLKDKENTGIKVKDIAQIVTESLLEST